MKAVRAWFGSVLVWLMVGAGVASAQTVGASIQGTVIDSTGAALPKAQALVRNLDTGAVQTVESDAAGFYRVPLLSPGDYEVRVSAPGFQAVVRRGISLAVGQDAVVDVTLNPGQVESEISVEASATAINLTSAALSGLVGDKQIRDLPLNGRSYEQLALLQTGVSLAVAAGNNVVGGRSPKLTINGARPEQNNFLLDGTDINNVYNKTPGSVAGVLLGTEAVLEFQVLTNAYSAEFGRSAGGVINAVTRSGANRFTGSVFEFLRNSALDARNFFNPVTQPKPSFKRNQFGGVLGGPVRRDKTFFFVAYEGLIERLGVIGVTSVPDLNARQGKLPNPDGTLRTVTLHPLIPTFLQTFFPLPNGKNLGGGVAEYLFSRSQPTNEHYLQGRIDHRFSDQHTIFGRYTFNNGHVDRQELAKPPVNFTAERSRNQYFTLESQRTYSAGLINIARLGYNRSTAEADNQRLVDIPSSLYFVPGGPFGYFTISGVVTEVAGDFRLPRNDHLNNFQGSDTVILTRGRHELRFGFQGQRIQFNQHTTSQLGGIMTFPSLERFLTGSPSGVDLAIPGKIDPDRGYRQWLWGFFAQDDFRVRPGLTLSLGLRYEFITVPTEVNGKISNLRTVNDKALTIGDPWHVNPSLRNFAPRIGLAWDPFGDGKTAVRAGFGLFYDEILPKYYFFSGSLNPPFTTRTTISTPRFPDVLSTPGFDPNRILAQLQTINFDIQSPYIMQYNLNVQRHLPGEIDLTVAYAGSRGNHLLRLGETDLAPWTFVNGVKVYDRTRGRLNPNFSAILQRSTDAQSFYNSLQVSAVKRLSRGVRAQVSYTFSRSIDDSSGINSQDFDNVVQYVSDWYDRTIDRGLSAFHVKHNLTFNWTWNLPFGNSLTGVARGLLKGWQLNNITVIRSGTPFTVRLGGGFDRAGNLNNVNFAAHQRPNLKPGASNNPILGGPDRYWDINAFDLPAPNTRGTLGRNTLIGPGSVGVDFSLAKSFKLTERSAVQFRTEVFNLPNHPNFAVPSGRVAFTGTRVVNGVETPVLDPNWGRITSTVTTSRQIQFALKLTF